MTNQQLSSRHQSRIYDFFKTLSNPFALQSRVQLQRSDTTHHAPEVPTMPAPPAPALVEHKKTTTTITRTTTTTTTTTTRTYKINPALPGDTMENPIIIDGAGDPDEVEIVSGPAPQPVRRICA
ncbi:hypothetical protein BDN72DRAFT_905493 [Pluteus cervinus]|uniref:Uncharacterized protein n=1 Tax=Pluteus cervinus TaxID=181527 RepID=A0ACD3A2A3_9AGAR|nr:hypothetical protein BDN72DRAFT_905493 [Pluteus cervinus]